MSCRGALAIRCDDRADAGDALCVESTRSTCRRRLPRYACLVRRTGRIAGWREWRQNCARANRYSQEERVTSRHGPYAECCAMSNVIGLFFRKTLHCGLLAILSSSCGSSGLLCIEVFPRLGLIPRIVRSQKSDCGKSDSVARTKVVFHMPKPHERSLGRSPRNVSQTPAGTSMQRRSRRAS